MKSKRLLHLVIILLVCYNVKAQIANEIKSYVDSTELIVNNGRKMLLNKLSTNDYVKAMEVYNYLTEITLNKNYSAFDFSEDFYINALTGNWQNLVDYMSEYNERVKKITYPNTYPVISIIYNILSLKSDSLEMECEYSSIDNEAKEVIKLFLHLVKTGHVDQEYNDLLKDYYTEYKISGYYDFLKNYLPGKKEKISLAFSLGSGMIITTDKLADNFASNASYNLSMDFNYQKVFSSLYANGSGLNLQRPFTGYFQVDSLVFEKNESFYFLDAGLKGGYFIIRNKTIHLASFLSVSGSVLESKRYDSNDDDMEYKILSSFTMGAGLHTEIKLKEFTNTNMYGYSSGYYLSLKFEAAYNYITKFKDTNFTGNTPYFIVALVYGIGDF